MKVGVSTASLFGRDYNEDALVTLNNIDAQVVEIFLESFCEYNEEYANLLKSRLGNLEVNSIHTLNTHYEPQLFSHNDRSYGDAVKIVENVLKCAKVLDSHNYTFHGRIRTKHGNFSNFEDTGNYFNKLIDIADKYDVNICLENVEWAMYNHVGYFEKLKPYSPRLRTCLDIKQARLTGYDYVGYLKEMDTRLNTVHISDYDENGRVLLPGKGLFNFEKLINELYQVSFSGNILIEVYQESFTKIEELSESLEYIRNIIKRG